MQGQRLDPITWADVLAAEARLCGKVGPSPLLSVEFLNLLLGRQIWLKAECLLPTGAFKLRGAYNKVAALTAAAGDLICASSGNHALGVAYAARALGRRAVLYVPTITAAAKKDNCRKLGATVIETGAVYDETYTAAKAACASGAGQYVHPVADTDIVAGQGTVAMEIVRQLPDVRQIVVPLGGGGLTSGIAFAAKTLNPAIRVVAVQAAGSPLYRRCLDAGRLVELDQVSTIADGLACKKAEPYLFEIIKSYVDEVIVVPEETIRHAMRIAVSHAKLVLEGSGAVALAAVLNGQVSLDHKTVVIASGSNIDPPKLLEVLEEGV